MATWATWTFIRFEGVRVWIFDRVGKSYLFPRIRHGSWFRFAPILRGTYFFGPVEERRSIVIRPIMTSRAGPPRVRGGSRGRTVVKCRM